MSAPNVIDFATEYSFEDRVTRLDANELNRRFLSLHQRLNSVELKGEGYDSLISEGTAAALRRINDGVAPLLASLIFQISAAETALNILQGQISAGITASQISFSPTSGIASNNVQSAVTEVLTTLQALIAATTISAGQMRARDLYFSNF